ncbi:MAG: hypothetical protein HFH36_10245 [Lachnospiraceae bacterium]|nr:hypothetical protein [Lachnospiraceae bacterium]
MHDNCNYSFNGDFKVFGYKQGSYILFGSNLLLYQKFKCADYEKYELFSDKISALIKVLDSVPSSIDSFNITLDDEGNILNYRFSGGGWEITVTQRNGQKNKETEEINEQERNQKLAAKRAAERKKQLEKAELDKLYQQSLVKLHGCTDRNIYSEKKVLKIWIYSHLDYGRVSQYKAIP